MATKDQTTAFVVAIPTPFAPSLAAIPQEQLIRVMTNPNAIDLSKQTLTSFIYKPNQTESKYALYDNSDVILEAKAPPRIPITEAIITTKGIIIVPAIILGVNK